MEKILFIPILCCLLVSCGNNNNAPEPALRTSTPSATGTPSPSAIPTQDALKLYGSTIIKQEVDNLTRADLWAIVPAADVLTEDDIKDCMTNIIKDYTSKNKVTAVTLYLADTEEDVKKSSYTLGRCMYYPGGKISNALTTTAGDYSKFTFEYDIRSRADKEPPSALELEIYDYTNNELEKTDDEDVVNQKVSKKYGITVDELNKIWNKVYTYKH